MPVPYEPVIRHAWSPGDVVCTPCHHQLPNGACEEEWCGCVCRDAEVLQVFHVPEDYGDRDAPEPVDTGLITVGGEPIFVQPTEGRADEEEVEQANDEPIKSDPQRKAGLDAWIAPVDSHQIDPTRLEKFAYRYRPLAACVIAMLQTVNLMLVVLTNTDGTWAEAFVIVSSILTAAFVLASVIRPKE